jgi:hypothetical protein
MMRDRSVLDSRSRISVWFFTNRPNRRTTLGEPVMPTVPIASSSSMIGRVMPGRTPVSSRAAAASCAAACRVRATSTEASWNVPTRRGSPLPMMMPSRPVITTLKPEISLVSRAIS